MHGSSLALLYHCLSPPPRSAARRGCARHDRAEQARPPLVPPLTRFHARPSAPLPRLTPHGDPCACSLRSCLRESPQLCSGRRRARTRSGRCALLRHGSSPAVGTPWSSGATRLSSTTCCASVRLRRQAAAALAVGIVASRLWAAPGPAVGCRWARRPRDGRVVLGCGRQPAGAGIGRARAAPALALLR
jgi:hypothetical protein